MTPNFIFRMTTSHFLFRAFDRRFYTAVILSIICCLTGLSGVFADETKPAIGSTQNPSVVVERESGEDPCCFPDDDKTGNDADRIKNPNVPPVTESLLTCFAGSGVQSFRLTVKSDEDPLDVTTSGGFPENNFFVHSGCETRWIGIRIDAGITDFEIPNARNAPNDGADDDRRTIRLFYYGLAGFLKADINDWLSVGTGAGEWSSDIVRREYPENKNRSYKQRNIMYVGYFRIRFSSFWVGLDYVANDNPDLIVRSGYILTFGIFRKTFYR